MFSPAEGRAYILKKVAAAGLRRRVLVICTELRPEKAAMFVVSVLSFLALMLVRSAQTLLEVRNLTDSFSWSFEV